jgi:hypothetical protein
MSIARWKHKLARLGALSGADRWLLLRAAWWLAVARVTLAVVPFRRLVQGLSPAGDCPQLGTVPTSSDPEFPRRVGQAVRIAAAHVPWRSDCFPQTLAARRLLRRRGYATTIHLGVERVGEAGLAGHAWLTCGDTVVTGGGELERYTELHRLSA